MKIQERINTIRQVDKKTSREEANITKQQNDKEFCIPLSNNSEC
jgi:hypothetical protein